jgi:hypothetical protein
MYHLREASGPDHEKHFRIEVSVDGRVLGAGEGSSRRLAETAAAAEALDTIRRERAAVREARAAARGDRRAESRGGVSVEELDEDDVSAGTDGDPDGDGRAEGGAA